MRHDMPATMGLGLHRGQPWSVVQRVIIEAWTPLIRLTPREPRAFNSQA